MPEPVIEFLSGLLSLKKSDLVGPESNFPFESSSPIEPDDDPDNDELDSEDSEKSESMFSILYI